MTWDALGALAELVGALAVLVTLIYLAVQVRNGQRLLEANVQATRQTALRELYLEMVRDPELSRAMRKANSHLRVEGGVLRKAIQEAGNLTEEEAAKLHAYFLADWVYRHDTFENMEGLSANQRRAFENQLLLAHNQGIQGVWYQALRHGHADREEASDIFAHIDRLNAERGNA